MIVFDLDCPRGHRFEGWFGSSRDFQSQQEGGLIACPQCGSLEIGKAPMAPAVPRKGGAVVKVESPGGVSGSQSEDGEAPLPIPPGLAKAVARIAAAQVEALRSSRWVGTAFAENSRAMHYGERKTEAIHGQASGEEARSLREEGIAVMPLLVPIAPPDEVN